MDDSKKGYSFWAKTSFVVFAFFCLIIFIYIRFPFDMFKDKLEQAVGKALNQQVTFSHVKSRLPLGLSIQGVEINSIPVATTLNLQPKISGLFTGVFGLGFDAYLIAGSIEGTFKTPLKGFGNPVEVACTCKDVDVAAFTKLFPANSQPKGIISGEINIKSPLDSFDKAEGSMTLAWKGGQMPVNREFLDGINFLKLNYINIETLDIIAHLDKGSISIDKADLKGDILTGSIKGSIRVNKDDFSRSRLNLSGEVMLPQGAMPTQGGNNTSPDQASKFTLRGTFDKPRFKWLTR